jgi:ascorbate-specific PTS system EIIC-type component UlaA
MVRLSAVSSLLALLSPAFGHEHRDDADNEHLPGAYTFEFNDQVCFSTRSVLILHTASLILCFLPLLCMCVFFWVVYGKTDISYRTDRNSTIK